MTTEHDHRTPATEPRRNALVGLLFIVMGAATLPMMALGVLATFIIDDLGITRAMFGWVLSVHVFVSALLSPAAGRITDRIGGRKGAALVLGASAMAFLTFGLAPALWLMFVASVIAAVAQAAGNPATNLLIRTHISEGHRGVATGVKQSGVQAAATAAGLLLPAAAISFGWGTAMVLVALIPLGTLLLTLWIVPASRSEAMRHERDRSTLPTAVHWLAAYGLVFGFAGSVNFYVPLYVEEAAGFDPRIAGVVAAVVGATAFVARIVWARLAERADRYLMPLLWMGVGSVVASILMALGASTTVLVWPGAIAIGASSSAWNSVGMLAVINKLGESTGRASGVVLFGFLIGVGIGPPLYGASIDMSGGYTIMWMISLIASAISAGIIGLWAFTSTDVWASSDSEPGTRTIGTRRN